MLILTQVSNILLGHLRRNGKSQANEIFFPYSLLCLSLRFMVTKRLPRIHPRGIFHYCQNQRSDQVGIRRRYKQQSWWVLMMPTGLGSSLPFNDQLTKQVIDKESFIFSRMLLPNFSRLAYLIRTPIAFKNGQKSLIFTVNFGNWQKTRPKRELESFI